MKMIPANPATIPTAAGEAAPHKNRFSVSRTAGTMPVYKPAVQPAAFNDDGTVKETDQKADSGFSFKDVLDVINPLQHIPLVSSLYQKVTGDEISAPARIIGGTLFGGPIGGALALADSAIKGQTGSTVGEKVIKLVSGDTEKDATIQIAQNTTIRKTNAARMAGTIPSWQGTMSGETHFAALINTLSGQNNNIS